MTNAARAALLATGLLACVAPHARADDQGALHFKPGASSTTVESAVIRGDRDIYHVGAKAGQTMTVRIGSTEDNAVITVYAPGTKASKDADGTWDFAGTAIAGGDTDISTWSGKLPASGEYLIVVGGTRGNADYRLTVAIR